MDRNSLLCICGTATLFGGLSFLTCDRVFSSVSLPLSVPIGTFGRIHIEWHSRAELSSFIAARLPCLRSIL